MAAARISTMHCSVNARVAGHDLCFRQETQDLVFARAEWNGIHEVALATRFTAKYLPCLDFSSVTDNMVGPS